MRASYLCVAVYLAGMQVPLASAQQIPLTNPHKSPIEEARQACLRTELGKLKLRPVIRALRAGIREGDVKAKVREVVSLLRMRPDVVATDVLPELVADLGSDPKTSVALERLFQVKTNHSVSVGTRADWSGRRQAWKALWAKLKGLSTFEMNMRGMRAAGLKLPHPKAAGSTQGAMAEYLKGLTHSDEWIRVNCYSVLANVLYPDGTAPLLPHDLAEAKRLRPQLQRRVEADVAGCDRRLAELLDMRKRSSKSRR